jgi:hypothetical protein
MKTKKLIYTAHSSETEKYAEYVFKFVFDQGAIAINPFLTLPTYMLTWVCTQGDRRATLETAINVMLGCDELWVFDETDDPGDIAKHGVLQEIKAWSKFKNPKKIRYVTWREAQVPKYVPGSGWSYDDLLK